MVTTLFRSPKYSPYFSFLLYQMECSGVSSACPVSDTLYGYYPSLPGNSLFAGIFGTCCIMQFMLGVKYHVKAYAILVILGCLGEAIGYIGRIMMHSNPWSSTAMSIQMLLLIISPSLLAAALYLTLKHLIIYLGPQYSRMKPELYTVVFITCDALGFCTQLVGGAIEAVSHTKNIKNIGNIIMIVGIVFQAATMAVCGLLGIDFTIRLIKSRKDEGGSPRWVPLPKSSRAFRFYVCCSIISFIAILIRCVYR